MTDFLRLNLQYFNDNEPTEFESAGIVETTVTDDIVRGGYNPDTEIDYSSMVSNPLLEEVTEEISTTPEEREWNPEQEQPYQEQFTQQPEYQQPDQYQQFLQQQQLIQQQMMQMNQNMAMQQQQFNEQQFAQPEIPQLSEEEQNEQMMEKFYDNPTQFFNDLKQQAIDEARKEIDPFIKEKRVDAEIQGLQGKYGQEFVDNIEGMRQIINEIGDAEVERIGLERVYLMARGSNSYMQPQQPAYNYTPEQIFADNGFVNEYIAQNPAVRNAVIQSYLAEKGNSQPPTLMGGQSGGATTLAPSQRPKSIQEASRLLRKSWGI